MTRPSRSLPSRSRHAIRTSSRSNRSGSWSAASASGSCTWIGAQMALTQRLMLRERWLVATTPRSGREQEHPGRPDPQDLRDRLALAVQPAPAAALASLVQQARAGLQAQSAHQVRRAARDLRALLAESGQPDRLVQQDRQVQRVPRAPQAASGRPGYRETRVLLARRVRQGSEQWALPAQLASLVELVESGLPDSPAVSDLLDRLVWLALQDQPESEPQEQLESPEQRALLETSGLPDLRVLRAVQPTPSSPTARRQWRSLPIPLSRSRQPATPPSRPRSHQQEASGSS